MVFQAQFISLAGVERDVVGLEAVVGMATISGSACDHGSVA